VWYSILLTIFQRSGESLQIDDIPSCIINKMCLLLHLPYGSLIEHVAGQVGGGDVDCHTVTTTEELVEIIDLAGVT
jgi:hypothetical protein